MKHLKTYKLFESQDFTWFKDLFLELKHEGFNVSVQESNTAKIDFSESGVIGSQELFIQSRQREMLRRGEHIKTIDVRVDKRVLDEAGHPTLKRFLIDEIKENLLFAESYAKDELGLEINYIFVSKIPDYRYYKSVEYLPFDSNWWIDSITFAFTKK